MVAESFNNRVSIVSATFFDDLGGNGAKTGDCNDDPGSRKECVSADEHVTGYDVFPAPPGG